MNHGVFILEEYQWNAVRYELGLRHEWQTIDVRKSTQPNKNHNGTSALSVRSGILPMTTTLEHPSRAHNVYPKRKSYMLLAHMRPVVLWSWVMHSLKKRNLA